MECSCIGAALTCHWVRGLKGKKAPPPSPIVLLKVVAHIGEWNAASPYVKNASNDFIIRGSHALPVSPSFWQELMGKAREWGLLVMKQDHINENIEGYQDNVTVLADWLAAQAQASNEKMLHVWTLEVWASLPWLNKKSFAEMDAAVEIMIIRHMKIPFHSFYLPHNTTHTYMENQTYICTTILILINYYYFCATIL